MLADIEFDRVDVQRQCMLKSLETIFQLFSSGATVTDNVKIFT